MKTSISFREKIPYDAMKKPIIYISMGSIISSRIFCKRCIKAFGDRNLSVVLNTGKVDPKTLCPVPRNIFAYSFVPQLEVLQNADLFITHCGMNSVNEAMCSGVPMLAMPIINDQISNAKRIAELGIGTRMRAFPITAAKLYRSTMQVLNDADIKKNVSSVKRRIEAENNFSDIVAKVEKCIK